MSKDKSDATDTIRQILDNNPSVGHWEIENIDQSNNSFLVDCRISHSRAFKQQRYSNVNGFDSIEFNEMSTADDAKGIKYTVILKETTIQ